MRTVERDALVGPVSAGREFDATCGGEPEGPAAGQQRAASREALH
jgi:hypothetical protein